ncbi:hypothetical protein CBS147332_9447 [Penicillium roqueforti]|nr:hypothetical protein CBS147332_9447 [Penicillium roqueforti]KAI3095781.1 hypothetical protein CBS147331_9423 [Penicillium roqueforti]
MGRLLRADFLAKRSNLVKLSRSKCGPNLASAATAADIVNQSARNVSLGYIRLERNRTSCAVHRVKSMELPNESMGVFFEYEIPNLSEAIVPYEEAETPEDMSTGGFKKFSTLRAREQYSTGAQHILGCTTMYIISRKGVYAVHWWENVSFTADDVWMEDGQTQDELFQSTVIDMLTDGGANHPKLDDPIEDEYIKAYIVRPTTTWDNVAGGYADQWETVRTTVGEIIPTLQDRSRWMDVTHQSQSSYGIPEAAQYASVCLYSPRHPQYTLQRARTPQALMYPRPQSPLQAHLSISIHH